jgi:hypothetical protein
MAAASLNCQTSSQEEFYWHRHIEEYFISDEKDVPDSTELSNLQGKNSKNFDEFLISESLKRGIWN